MTTDLRVLVVDDSPFCAEAIAIALEEEPGIRVVGFAHDGRQAVELTRKLRPDLVTMDVQMPVMNGLQALERIMAESPTRVLVLTSDPRGQGGELSFEAIALGALDLLPKTDLTTDDLERRKLRQKVRLLGSVPLAPRPPRKARSSLPGAARSAAQAAGVIGIVTSTGGPSALESVLGALPPGLPAAIAVVQHLPHGFAERLVQWLRKVCRVEIQLAEQGGALLPGVVYLAPDDHHLLIDPERTRLDGLSGPVGGHRPSGSMLLRSIARSWGTRGAGVVLTGMGDDGAEGLLEIRRAGGPSIAQDSASSVVDGMPAAARELGAASEVLSLQQVPERLVSLARGWAP